MKYRVVITDTAKQDLREIGIWIAEQSKNKELAKKFIGNLHTEIKKLATFPNAGALPKDRILRSAGFRYVVHKDYLMFYTVDEERDVVNVMAVFNAKKDYIHVMRHFI